MRHALIALALLTGCGASALQVNARAAIVAGETLGSTRTVLVAHLRSELEACQDMACIERTAQSHTAALAAYESARSALAIWVESIALAHAANSEGGASLSAVLSAAQAFVGAYGELATAYNAAGIELPALPTEVRSALGGAR